MTNLESCPVFKGLLDNIHKMVDLMNNGVSLLEIKHTDYMFYLKSQNTLLYNTVKYFVRSRNVVQHPHW